MATRKAINSQLYIMEPGIDLFDHFWATRIMLAQQLNWWGPGTFQEQLEKAYQDFVAYCRTKKLGHSQPPFKLSKVFWLDIVRFTRIVKHVFPIYVKSSSAPHK